MCVCVCVCVCVCECVCVCVCVKGIWIISLFVQIITRSKLLYVNTYNDYWAI